MSEMIERECRIEVFKELEGKLYEQWPIFGYHRDFDDGGYRHLLMRDEIKPIDSTRKFVLHLPDADGQAIFLEAHGTERRLGIDYFKYYYWFVKINVTLPRNTSKDKEDKIGNAVYELYPAEKIVIEKSDISEPIVELEGASQSFMTEIKWVETDNANPRSLGTIHTAIVGTEHEEILKIVNDIFYFDSPEQ